MEKALQHAAEQVGADYGRTPYLCLGSTYESVNLERQLIDAMAYYYNREYYNGRYVVKGYVLEAQDLSVSDVYGKAFSPFDANKIHKAFTRLYGVDSVEIILTQCLEALKPTLFPFEPDRNVIRLSGRKNIYGGGRQGYLKADARAYLDSEIESLRLSVLMVEDPDFFSMATTDIDITLVLPTRSMKVEA